MPHWFHNIYSGEEGFLASSDQQIELPTSHLDPIICLERDLAAMEFLKVDASPSLTGQAGVKPELREGMDAQTCVLKC